MCRMAAQAGSGLPMIGLRSLIVSVVLVAAALLACALPGAARQEQARMVPPPVQDEGAGSATSETAVFAGGCFWGVQGVFQHVKGVTNAVSGYAGGDKRTAQYEEVGTGRTGHAESVQVTYDPRVITYGRRTMPPYGAQNRPHERWAIVAYLRVLQRAQHGTMSDVPESDRATLAYKPGPPPIEMPSLDAPATKGAPKQ